MGTLKNILCHLFSEFAIRSWNRPYGLAQTFIGTVVAIILTVHLSSCGSGSHPKNDAEMNELLTHSISSKLLSDTMTVLETKVVDIEGIKTEWVVLASQTGLHEYMKQVPKLSTYGDLVDGTKVLVQHCVFNASWSNSSDMYVIVPLK